MSIKAIIVDDEINGRENLRSLLAKYCPDVNILGEAESAAEAICQIKKCQPNLIFLDIEMPGGNGFEVLNHFTEPEFKVIFVTAYDQYAIQAIRFSALDYLLKPLNALELQAAVERFAKNLDQPDQRIEQLKSNTDQSTSDKKIALTFSDKIEFVPVREIIKCRGEGAYTHFYLTNQKAMLTSKPLTEYEELLEDFGFIRTHKAHLVNLAQVKTFVKAEGGYLLMSDDSTVPVSRRKKDEVINALKGTK